jgi:hypothetical protein
MQHSEPSQEVKQAVAKAADLVNWIYMQLPKIELPGDHRHRIPAQLFDLAIEHAVAILRLVSTTNHASAFALVRCEFECFVRGAWLHYRASDAEIETFVNQDRIAPKFADLIVALEQGPPFNDKLLSHVKDSAWGPMNGYTHGGIHQVSHRLQGDYIEPNFEDDAVLEVVQFAGTLALMAYSEIAHMAGREELVAEAQAKMDSGTSTMLPAAANCG